MASSVKPSDSNPYTSQTNMFFRIIEIFPEACPEYIRALCSTLTPSKEAIDAIITKLLSEDYPRRKKRRPIRQNPSPEEQFNILKELLPDMDPTYLRTHCTQLTNKPEELADFITNALENRNYPTMHDYRKREQLSTQKKQYMENFEVSKFLEVIPDPVAHFKVNQPGAALKDEATLNCVSAFLKNKFNMISAITIGKVLNTEGGLQGAHEKLMKLLKNKEIALLKAKRKYIPYLENCENIPLLQEMAYLSHKQEILEYMQRQKEMESRERMLAKRNGTLMTCQCCYDEEILQKDLVMCDLGCIFCKLCVQRAVEIAFGEGKLEFSCLTNCTAHFNLQILQSALSPKLFSKICQKKQMEEVKAAGIADLEMCPYCDFATIPIPTDKIFRCLNPECMKESCRQCKRPSHLPYKCNEIVENDDEVKKRVYIENKMTEALLKKCYKCGKRFIKSDGCNRIQCPCGATQCYLCGEPVTSYRHFNGQGGEEYQKCLLYTETEALHEQAVLTAAEAAKLTIGVTSNDQLKYDPMQDIRDYYAELKKKAKPLPPGMVPHPNLQRNLQHTPPQLPPVRRNDTPRLHAY